MTTGELIARVYTDLAHPAANNDRLPRETVLGKLNQGYEEFAKLTKSLRRDVSLPATSERAQYRFPEDYLSVQGGVMGWGGFSSPILESTEEMQSARLIAWRATSTVAAPTAFVPKEKQFLLVPAPFFIDTKSIVFTQHVQPYSCGGGIANIARVSGVVTVVTKGDHGLVVGDRVGVHGVTAEFSSVSASPSETPSASTSR